MPYLAHRRPTYRRHRQSKQAFVEIAGKRHYLGPYGSPESQTRFSHLVDSWIGLGRPRQFSPLSTVLAAADLGPFEAKPGLAGPPKAAQPQVPCGQMSIVELVANFWEHAKERYEKHGRQTGTHENYRPVLRLLKERYGELPVCEFGPRALKQLKREMKQQGNSRRYVNDNIDRIRRVFVWGVSEECVPPQVVAALETVESVHVGEAGVVEHAPVEAVSDDVIVATLKHLPGLVADMVRVQLLTGCRPGELCAMRPQDVDRTGKVWVYRPWEHKTEHHGKQRVIAIGPQAQKILRPYLRTGGNLPCFSPALSERKRSRLRRQKRGTPLTPSQAARAPKADAKRRPGDYYSNDSYRRAIARACDKAFPPPPKLSKGKREAWRKEHRWSPNQLRHAAATKICERFDSLLAAQQVLGHGSVKTTEIYAKPSPKLAMRVMAEMG